MYSYSAANYMVLSIAGFILSTVVLVALLLSATWLISKLNKNLMIMVLVDGFLILLWLLGCIRMIPVLEKTEDLFPVDVNSIKVTAGRVDMVTAADDASIYVFDGKVLGAEVVTIGGNQYYKISEPSVHEGMYVHIEYVAGQTQVIMRWQEVSAKRAQEILIEQDLAAKEPLIETHDTTIQISNGVKYVSVVLVALAVVGFCGSLSVVMVSQQKIVAWLLAQDAQYAGGIEVNRKVLSFAAVPVFSILLLHIGLSLRCNDLSALPVLFMAAVIAFLLLNAGCLRTLHVDSQILTIRRFGRNKSFPLSDVSGVFWRNCRGLIGKELVIVINGGGVYTFSMDIYRGVQKTYDLLKNFRETQ